MIGPQDQDVDTAKPRDESSSPEGYGTRADNGDAPATAPGYLAGGGQIIGPSGPGELPLHGWPAAIASLRYPIYRILWFGALISNIGAWAQTIARDWLVYELGGEAGKFWLGVNAFAEGVLLVLILPLGGVLADRFSRRWILVVGNAGNAMLAAILAALSFSGALQVWHIIVLTALNGAMDGIRIPANQSLLPDLVGASDLRNAIALNSLQFNLSRVIGPAIGGAALLTLGAHWSFTVNSVSFLGVIIPLVLITHLPSPHAAKQGLWSSMSGGLRYLLSRRDLLLFMATVILGGALSAPVTKLLPALAAEFGRGAGGFSTLLTAFGAGAVVGAAAIAARGRSKGSPSHVFVILIALGGYQIALAMLTDFHWAAVAVAGCGGLFISAMVRLISAILESTPSEVRGRIASFNVLAFRMGMPIGGLIAGALAQRTGLTPTIVGFGVALITIALVTLLLVRRLTLRDAGTHPIR